MKHGYYSKLGHPVIELLHANRAFTQAVMKMLRMEQARRDIERSRET